jgi:hypothetical protein
MKTIGMLGEMSWESTAEYYRLANELVRERLGDLHSARVVLDSRGLRRKIIPIDPAVGFRWQPAQHPGGSGYTGRGPATPTQREGHR